jgi:hypothetical protein
MARLSLGRRLSTATRWPVGVSLTSWRYMWRTTPMSRREVELGPGADRPPPLPAGFDTDGVQTHDDGVGTLFHRRYRIRIAGPACAAPDVVGDLPDDLDAFAPSEFARFIRLSGDGRCAAGDEYVVRMPGPWDGPVRVVDVSDASIRLATLDGHLEAGQIEFRAADHDGELAFTIESWARSSSRLTDFLYDRARMSKEVQVHMWVSFLERVRDRARGRRSGPIDIETRRIG